MIKSLVRSATHRSLRSPVLGKGEKRTCVGKSCNNSQTTHYYLLLEEIGGGHYHFFHILLRVVVVMVDGCFVRIDTGKRRKEKGELEG